MTVDFLATTGVTIVCTIYAILILIMYSFKSNITRYKSKLFKFLLYFTIITTILYIITGYMSSNNIDGALIMARILSLFIIQWEILLICYLSMAFTNEHSEKKFIEKNKKINIILTILLWIINIILSFTLSIEFNHLGPGMPYTMSGGLVLYYNILGILGIVSSVIFMIINRKEIDKISVVLCTMTIIYCVLSFLLESIIHEPVNDVPFTMVIVIIFLYLSVESQDAILLADFNESNKKAKESNELKSEFIMNMSHQLRTPMNTILGFSESLLLDDNASLEEVREDSKNIKLSSKRLLELINSILDISKLESNKEVLNNEDYNLDTLIYDLSSHINSKIDKENLIFSINANENCPNNLYGDDYKLAKVLNIFLSNAVKYTNYGEVSLNVSSKQIDNENHEFVFHIKNTGHAMKTENFERSFEDLIKLNSDTNNDIDADTLKIIVAKGLLNIINGKVEFINEPGQGTQYIITITQKVTSPGELGNIREKIQTKHAITYQELNLLGKKALIIDDTKINSIILERLLKQYNLEIISTTNPRDGIDKATNENFDIIFVNHQMEELSGEEVVSKLESTGNKIPPVIGLINKSDDARDSYDETIICPIEFRELNKIIKKEFN